VPSQTYQEPADVRDENRGEHAPPLGFAERVALTFTAPARLFAAFPGGAPWAGVLLLSTLVAMIAAAAQPPEFFLAQVDGAVNRRGVPVEITSGPAEIVRYGRYLAVMSALAGHPLVVLGLAGLLTLLFGFAGGRPRFSRYLPVAAHASLVLVLGAVVGIGVRLLTGEPFAELTLAYLFAPLGVDPARQVFLDSINVFSLWTIAVLAIGVSVIDRRPSWLRPFAALLGFYLALATVTSLLA
jgi:hypothetical protein